MLEVLADAVEHDADTYETMTHTLSDEDAMHQALKKWLDMDRVVSQYCLEQGLGEPTALDERLALHLTAMEQWMQLHIKGENNGNTTLR